MRWLAFTLLAGVLGSAALEAQTTIDTRTGHPNGASNPSPDWVHGQSFTVPSIDHYLNVMGFVFFGNAGEYALTIHAWNGMSITGPAIFQSAVFTVSQASPDLSLDASAGDLPSPYYYEWRLGSLNLTPGGMYLAQLAAVNAGGSYLRIVAGDAYDGGHQVTHVGGETVNYTFYDATFRADFGPVPTVVPEPSTLGLLACGLLLLGIVARPR